MIIKNLIINGNSEVIPFLNTTAKCKWMWLKAPATNSHPVLIGGAEVSPSPLSGYPLGGSDAAEAIFIPNVSDMMEFYQFGKCYCYVALGDVLNVLYGLEGSNS
jgi:hypothetical protein